MIADSQRVLQRFAAAVSVRWGGLVVHAIRQLHFQLDRLVLLISCKLVLDMMQCTGISLLWCVSACAYCNLDWKHSGHNPLHAARLDGWQLNATRASRLM